MIGKDDTLLNDIAACNAILKKKISEEMLTLVIIFFVFLLRSVFKFHKFKNKVRGITGGEGDRWCKSLGWCSPAVEGILNKLNVLRLLI